MNYTFIVASVHSANFVFQFNTMGSFIFFFTIQLKVLAVRKSTKYNLTAVTYSLIVCKDET
ncbi:unnamed protein product [Heterobilharzia americana]|nr:unnamed protein product [Heterobilharzia americana]